MLKGRITHATVTGRGYVDVAIDITKGTYGYNIQVALNNEDIQNYIGLHNQDMNSFLNWLGDELAISKFEINYL